MSIGLAVRQFRQYWGQHLVAIGAESLRPRAPLLVLLGCLTLLLLYEIQDLARFHYALIQNDKLKLTSSDFLGFYLGTRRFLAGADTLYEINAARNLTGYTYPPLSVAFYAPFGLFGQSTAHAIFLVSSAGALVVALWLTLRTRRLIYGKRQSDQIKAIVFALLVAASGPSFSTFVSNQVNAIVILMCLGAVYLGLRQCSFVGAILLAFGCWIKIYPALLILAMLAIKSLRATAYKAMAFAVVLPAMLLWLIPLGLYERYLFDLLPSMAGRVTSHLYNQSITASAVRLGLPFDQWSRYLTVDVPLWIRAVNVAVLVAALGLFRISRVRRASNPLLVVLIALAFIPLIAPLGWGHSFLFSTFLVAYCAVYGKASGTRIIAALAWVLLLIPAYSELRFLRDLAPALTEVLYFRYPIAVAAVIVVAIAQAGQERLRDREPEPLGGPEIDGHD